MISNLGLNRALWTITSIIVLLVTSIGITSPDIYQSVVDADIIPGILTQDVLAGGSALLMLILGWTMQASDHRKYIINQGILGFFFYAFGIYSIEQVYNWLYPGYLAIFALSFFSLAYGLASFKEVSFRKLNLPTWLRFLSAGYGILIAIMFNFIWINQLIPLLRTGNRIENTFSIFIIDLCFIMPAFVITAIMTVRKKPLGEVGLPALFVLGVGILSPLAMAELIKPALFAMPVNQGEFWLYFILSVVFMVLATFYLASYREPGLDEK